MFIKNSITITWCGCLVLTAANAIAAAPNLQGQIGYINMPSARIEADGTFSTGYSYDRPYATLWASATVLPFLQMTGRYMAIGGTPGFSNAAEESSYGRYKDKIFDAKLNLWSESAWLPAVSAGFSDILGTEFFKGQYLVATKTFGAQKNIEASVGYGHTRPDGIFAGARWAPTKAPNWAMVVEYDATDYSKDFRAAATDAGTRRKGSSVGLEYRWGWLGAQIARHRDHFSANAYLSVPLAEREFIPKVLEPVYFQPKDAPPRATIQQWAKDPRLGAALLKALARQDYKNVRLTLDGTTLNLTLSNSRISNLGRAIGRASRTALAFAPEGTHALRVTYTKLDQPIATFEFSDLNKLSDYFAGVIDRSSFLTSVMIRYGVPADRIEDDLHGMLAAIDDDARLGVRVGLDGDIVQLRSEDREANRFKVVPKLGLFFNDPSGALRYEIAAAANYDKRLREGMYLNSAFKLNLFENVSGVTQTSNSVLPHVRTDIAEYKRASRFKLNRMMVNQFLTPGERLYARLSVGFYEEMYRGFGGQLLYLPKDSRWAADMSIDALQQRGYKGWLGKRDYQTVTAIGAMHYHLPYDITVTGRVGRFLARDAGARLELKRTFRSGIEVGAWYTKTSGKDITNPGTPTSPYNDKGIFMSIPLKSMSPIDTLANANIAIAPWTRDVGQMVSTPGDLFEMVEHPRRDLTNYDGLGNFAERADEQELAAVSLPVKQVNPWPAFHARIDQSTSSLPSFPEWARGTGLAAGAVLASALLDKPVDRFVKNHADSALARDGSRFGKAMPVALVGAAGAALAFGDARLQNTGLIALESVAGALGISVGTKYIVGRARPDEERGPWVQVGNGRSRANASFPSAHSAIAFAAVTPFAQEYGAPWLYGVAAASAMGRVAGRQHWVSDTVAGGIIGYATGSWLWNAQRDNQRSQLSISPGPKEISVAWQTKY